MNKQARRVLDYMKQFGSITALDAFRDLSVARLAARIKDLRDAGFHIVTERESAKNRYGETVSYARYKLVNTPVTRAYHEQILKTLKVIKEKKEAKLSGAERSSSPV